MSRLCKPNAADPSDRSSFRAGCGSAAIMKHGLDADVAFDENPVAWADILVCAEDIRDVDPSTPASFGAKCCRVSWRHRIPSAGALRKMLRTHRGLSSHSSEDLRQVPLGRPAASIQPRLRADVKRLIPCRGLTERIAQRQLDVRRLVRSSSDELGTRLHKSAGELRHVFRRAHVELPPLTSRGRPASAVQKLLRGSRAFSQVR